MEEEINYQQVPELYGRVNKRLNKACEKFEYIFRTFLNRYNKKEYEECNIN